MDYKLEDQEADLIVKALGELPYKVSANLIVNLQKQFQDNHKQETDE